MKDSYGRNINYLRISLTERCNLRCRYCMPAEGITNKLRHEDMLTEDELLSIITEAASLGINKLRFTGGEPLIKRNILSVVERAGRVEGITEMVLTTNGILLSEMAADLKAAGISRINLSLDTLSPEKYHNITRCGNLEDALAGLGAALAVGFKKIKVNAVLIGGFNTDEIYAMAGLTHKNDLDLRFIELMPMDNYGEFGPEAFVPSKIVLQKLPELKFVGREGVADMYRLPGAMGCVGLISPVTCSFCSECNRLRLTADGRLLPCLHSPLEFPLKGLDRQQIHDTLIKAIGSKPEQHSKLSGNDASEQTRAMNRIGG